MTRKNFITGMLVAGLAGRLPLRANARPPGKNLLRDSHLREGLAVLHIDPPAGPRDPNDTFNGDWIAGFVRPAEAAGEPVWRAAQWYSRFDLAGAKRESPAPGIDRFFDGAKTVTFGAAGTDAADVSLRLNGRTEWRDASPVGEASWPHLLVSQRFVEAPTLAGLTALRLSSAYRLTRLDVHRDENWNEARNSAKFSLFLTLQNRNAKSQGHGDYLWFGAPFFDSRFEVARRFVARDRGNGQKRGTNKFIYNPGGAAFGLGPVAPGRWQTFSADIAGMIGDAMEAAWSAGYLTDSRELRDYTLGSVNLGWETIGPIDAEMQVKDLCLET